MWFPMNLSFTLLMQYFTGTADTGRKDSCNTSLCCLFQPNRALLIYLTGSVMKDSAHFLLCSRSSENRTALYRFPKKVIHLHWIFLFVAAFSDFLMNLIR